MDILFFLLSILMSLLIIIGMIKPTLVLPRGLKKRRRKQVLTLYIPLLLVFFITFVSVVPDLTLEEKAEQESKRVEKNIKREEAIQAEELEVLNKTNNQQQEDLKLEESLKKQKEDEKKQKELEEIVLKKKDEVAQKKRTEEEKIKQAAELEKKEKELKLKTELENQSKIDNQYTLGVTTKQFLKAFNSALKDNGLDMKAKTDTKDYYFELVFLNGDSQFDGIIAHGLLNKDGTIRALFIYPNAASTLSQDLRFSLVYTYTMTSVIQATNNKSANDALSILEQVNSSKSFDENGTVYKSIEKMNIDGEETDLPGSCFFVKSSKDNLTVELNNNVMEFKGQNIQK